MVDPRFDWGATRVTPSQFERQIEFALERGFTFYTLTEAIFNNKLDDSRSIALTFDDGYQSIFQYAFPILKKYNIRATVFVMPYYVGQYNTWDVNIGWLRFAHLDWKEIKTLADHGWEIGSHSLNHHDLTRLAAEDLKRELELSKLILEQQLQNAVTAFSFPFGNANQNVVKEVMAVGYRAATVMNRKIPDVPPEFAIRRLGVYLFDSLFTFHHKISQRHLLWHRGIQGFLDVCSNGTVLVKYGLKKSVKNST